MSRNARLGVLAGVIAIGALAFVLLRPGDDSPRTSAATTPAATTRATTSTTATPAAPPVTRIRVAGGKPVGGVRDVTVKQGDRIRLVVTADQPEHVHLHGYDIEKPVGPGEPARYDVRATINGVFEIELEDSSLQLAKLTVEP